MGARETRESRGSGGAVVARSWLLAAIAMLSASSCTLLAGTFSETGGAGGAGPGATTSAGGTSTSSHGGQPAGTGGNGPGGHTVTSGPGGKPATSGGGNSGTGGSGGGSVTAGTGGNSGTGGFGGKSVTVGTGGSGGSSVTVGAGGSDGGCLLPACDPMLTCAGAVANGGVPCAGSPAYGLYEAVVTAVCAAGSSCQAACAASVCCGLPVDAACLMCGSSQYPMETASCAASCLTPNDCPAPPVCQNATCPAGGGVCGTSAVLAGVLVAPDMPADCLAKACDGNGNTKTAVDDTNVPVPANPCLAGTCVNGTPGTTPVMAGAVCHVNGGAVCDGAGQCVGVSCTLPTDCPMGDTCSAAHTCVLQSCADNVKDGSETDVDCGGGMCPPCADKLNCVVAADCVLGSCADSGSGKQCQCAPNVGLTECNEACVDTSSDPNNCTMCGNACTTSVANSVPACVAGLCGYACDAGLLACGSACIDVSSDPNNCGACGKTCVMGLMCTQGACCFAQVCNGVCVDESQDSSNCGGCGNACPGGTSCTGSVCCPMGLSGCSGACFDLTSDAKNCGSCGHDCQGGKCLGGSCQPFSLGVGKKTPWAIAVDQTNVYWVVNENPTVYECPLAGCPNGTPIEMFSGQSNLYGVATDGANVYWTSGGQGVVSKCPVSGCVGGVPDILASGQTEAYGIATDGMFVYWTTNTLFGQVLQCPVSGCIVGPNVLASGSYPFGVAVAQGSVCWTNNTNPGSVQCYQNGNAVAVTAATGQASPSQVAIAAGVVVWTNQGKSLNDGSVASCALGQACGDGLEGGPGPTLVASAQGVPVGLSTDQNKAIHWVDTYSFNVMGSFLFGGMPTVLTKATAAPYAITEDATSVYWTQSDGSIWKLAK